MQVILSGGNPVSVPIRAPVSGYVYAIHVDTTDNKLIESRLDVMVEIVEEEERFTNLMEYNARDIDGDGIIDGRSTDPLNPDTDGDGLKDGIEVMGWDILVVNRESRMYTLHQTQVCGIQTQMGYLTSKNSAEYATWVPMHRMQTLTAMV